MFLGNTYSQDKAYIIIKKNREHPFDEYNKIARRNNYTWKINNSIIRYKDGKYEIKINKTGTVDTIVFSSTFIESPPFVKIRKILFFKFEERQKKIDTINTLVFCKFQPDHTYKITLGTHRNEFELFSIDSIETKKEIVFNLKNIIKNDTFHLVAYCPPYEIHSDTTIHINYTSVEWQENTQQYIGLTKDLMPYGISHYEFEFKIQFLHSELFFIDYDCKTKKYSLIIK